MSTILSIDPSGNPAGHTGIVLLEYDDTHPVHALNSWAVQGGVPEFRHWYGDHVEGDYVNDDYIWWSNENSLMSVSPVETVVCEKFMPRGVPGADYTPLVMEGAIEWVFPNVVFDPASGYKTAVPDEVLKRLGLWWTGDHHGDRNSAARHGVRWLKNQLHKPTLQAGWNQL